MATVELVNGLGGAIGSDYRPTQNRLFFVEFSGKVSVLNLVRPLVAKVSQGTTTLKGTWILDLETGVQHGNLSGPGDIWWEQQTAVLRRMTPVGGAKIINLGVVNFNSITHAELQNLTYGTTPIPGNNDPSNKLVNGDVFAVLTNNGNFAKVRVINYGYNMLIQWVTYKVGPRYQVLGTGYNQPEDIVVSEDEQHAYVTERTGNLLRVDLANANRAMATVVSTGMTAPHQIALDEAHNQAYVVEYANPGRLLRIDLASGAQTVLVSDLQFAIGLLLTHDQQFAYVSEQSPTGGQISRITLNTGNREVLATGLVSPFMLTWANAGEGALLVAERDPANRISLLDLSMTPTGVAQVAIGLPSRPSSVELVTAERALVCSDSVISQVDLTGGAFVASGPMLMGIGHVPKSAISADGYATTDPGYFFQVKDSPFGGTLAVMFNHERARDLGAKYYRILVDGVPQSQGWSDYKWSSSDNAFKLTTTPQVGSFFKVRQAGEIWYNHWLGYFLNTQPLTNGPHTLAVQVFASASAASIIPAGADNLTMQIDNQWPQVSIDQIIHDGSPVDTCAIVKSGSTLFTFDIVALDAEQHLLSWSLTALWGDNKSKAVASDHYNNHISPTKQWAGVSGIVPAPAWDATEPGDPTSTHCAHTFYLGVWDRVIDGWNYIHYATYHKSITIDIP